MICEFNRATAPRVPILGSLGVLVSSPIHVNFVLMPGKSLPFPLCGSSAAVQISIFWIGQAADESPSAAELADGQDQFIAALLQWKKDGIIFCIHDPQKSWVAEILGTAATQQNLAIQKDTYIVAITDIKLLHMVTIRIDAVRA